MLTRLRKNRARTRLSAKFRSIGIDQDYSALDLDGLSVDLQGWGSDRPIFADVMAVQPALVIEVGTWKGASLLHMRSLSPKTQFIAVDTWLGSALDLWLEHREALMLVGGYPTFWRQFIYNLLAHGAEHDVYPLPMTSTAAARVLAHLEIVADAIYIDCGHDEEEVAVDLRRYWRLLRPGGVMFGDDYNERWRGVVRAVDAFASQERVPVAIRDEMWRLGKPIS